MMGRSMGDQHKRFERWLLEGAPAPVPRDLAVHAVVCVDCTAVASGIASLQELDLERTPRIADTAVSTPAPAAVPAAAAKPAAATAAPQSIAIPITATAHSPTVSTSAGAALPIEEPARVAAVAAAPTTRASATPPSATPRSATPPSPANVAGAAGSAGAAGAAGSAGAAGPARAAGARPATSSPGPAAAPQPLGPWLAARGRRLVVQTVATLAAVLLAVGAVVGVSALVTNLGADLPAGGSPSTPGADVLGAVGEPGSSATAAAVAEATPEPSRAARPRATRPTASPVERAGRGRTPTPTPGVAVAEPLTDPAAGDPGARTADPAPGVAEEAGTAEPRPGGTSDPQPAPPPPAPTPAPPAATPAPTPAPTPVPVAGISISDSSVAEGDLFAANQMVFTVTRSGPTDQRIVVNWTTANGSARTNEIGNDDYEGASGQIVFEPGVTSGIISVTVNGDITREGNETFYVNLSLASGVATLSDGQGVGTIVDEATDV